MIWDMAVVLVLKEKDAHIAYVMDVVVESIMYDYQLGIERNISIGGIEEIIDDA